MEEEIQEGGISIGEVFRTIFSQKWLALIIALAITVAGTVGLYFYGRTTRVYSVKFVLQFPGSDNSPASYAYPNGSNFYFTDLVSAENLAAIKQSSEDYKNINVAKMVKEGDISIVRETTDTNATTGKTDAVYTINAKAKYFGNQDIARTFLTEVTRFPINYIKGMNINYDMYITAAKEAVTYDIEFDFLTNQVEYMQAIYDKYIETYGSSFVVDGGKTLLSYRSDLNVFISNGSISNLRTESYTKYYIKSNESKEKYLTDKEELELQLEIEKQTLDILAGASGGDGQSSIITTLPDIQPQVKLVKELEQKKGAYEKLAEYGKVNAEFNNSVSKIEDEVSALTEDFAKVSKAIFANATSVSFADVNVIVLQSKMGLLLSGGISLLAGLVIAALVAYIVGYCKNKKAAPVSAQTASEIEVPENKDDN